MFRRRDDAPYRTPLAGIRQRTLVHGDKTLLVEFVLDGGTTLPVHRHP